jgi:hypothetical protein
MQLDCDASAAMGAKSVSTLASMYGDDEKLSLR